MTKRQIYSPDQLNLAVKPNRWDLVMLFVLLALMVLIASFAKQLDLPFKLGQPINISLNPWMLPSYAFQTVLRLFIALFFSLMFTFVFATWAARNRQAEKVIIPIIDVLQSVPVLAFLSLTIVGFIKLFPNSLLGPQCAVIFLIFTAQVWNMALSFYQSLKSIPKDFLEVADMLGLSAWQRFWRIEAPFAMPALLWNMMLSMSVSWFSLVASEAITVEGQKIAIPGIGSYIALAIERADGWAIAYAILTMIIIILLYDQLIFRPLVKWAEKFKVEHTNSDSQADSWVMNLWLRTRVLKALGGWLGLYLNKIINMSYLRRAPNWHPKFVDTSSNKSKEWLWNLALIALLVFALIILLRFIYMNLSMSEVLQVFYLGCFTGLRVLATVVISTIIWVPIGVWIGLRPRVAAIVQPFTQFLAAFPANLLFPIVIAFIVTWKLNVNVWTTPLMILGSQWYILFNVIAGVMAIPKDLKHAAASFDVKGWLWWRTLILPAIFPYYITGAITAVGGAWNASIVAEVVVWGKTTLVAKGLGAYIAEYTGNFAHTVLGVSVMCLFVFTLNHILWRPLYRFAITRYQMD